MGCNLTLGSMEMMYPSPLGYLHLDHIDAVATYRNLKLSHGTPYEATCVPCLVVLNPQHMPVLREGSLKLLMKFKSIYRAPPISDLL